MCQAITFNKRLLSDMLIADFRQMVWQFLFQRRLEKDDYNIFAASTDECIYAAEFRTKGKPSLTFEAISKLP